MRALVLTLCLAMSELASAQLGGVRLPQLPSVGLPSVPGAAAALEGGNELPGSELDPRRLEALRADRVRELLRRHGDVLEADPHGVPFVRGEVLALAPSPDALAAAAAAGFTVLREETFAAIDLHVVVLKARARTALLLQQLQSADPAGTYDFNHVYTDSGVLHAAAAADAAAGTHSADSAGSGAGAGVRLGLIDSGVAAAHEVFAGITIEGHGCAGAQAPPGLHATAVASLMVGRAAALHGAAPGAALYAADVFCGQPTGGSVDAVAEAFTWLLAQHVAVVNVSLVGPPNKLLERVVHEVVAHGCLVVAAVGNDGPAAPPLYPAAWPGVIGVTAVDARGRVLVEAGRGPQVKFAAPGADMAAARVGGGYVPVRGTSFAAPIVAGLLALTLPQAGAPTEAVSALARVAQHPGSSSAPDPVYGYGVVGSELRQQPALAASRSRN